MLFAGTELGTVRSYKFPLTGDFAEIQARRAPRAARRAPRP